MSTHPVSRVSRSFLQAGWQWSRLLLPVLLAVTLSACSRGQGDAKPDGADDGTANQPPPVPVEVAAAAARSISASYTGTAALEPRAESQVVAKTSGVALRVYVEEGQAVRAGQTLVKLDDDRIRLQLAQAQVQVNKLEANHRRAAQLAEQRMVSTSDLDQLRYDLEAARANLRVAQLELTYTNVTAPISGVVATRSIKAGNFVQINTPIFRIVDTARLEATLNVPERELDTLKPGQPVVLAVDALPGRQFNGQVDRVAPVVDSGSGTFRVIAAFDGGGVLQPGMFGRLRIDYDQRADALAIPRAALLEDESSSGVFVVSGETVARRPVKTGYVDGGFVEIRDGLKAGEQVVTAGKSALRDGMRIQILDAAGKVIGGAKDAPAKKPDAQS